MLADGISEPNLQKLCEIATYSIVAVVNHFVHVSHTLIKLIRQLLLKHRQFLTQRY